MSIPTVFIPTKVDIKTIGMEIIFIKKQAIYLSRTVLSRCSDGGGVARGAVGAYAPPEKEKVPQKARVTGVLDVWLQLTA